MADKELYCYGCHWYAVWCPVCAEEGMESLACECSDYHCDDDHDCTDEFNAAN